MGRDNQPLYVQPRSPSTQPPPNEQLQRQRDNLFTRLLLSVLLQSTGQAHYQIKDDMGTIIPHLLMPTPSATDLLAVKQEESQPESASSHALDVDATNPHGDRCSDPYRDNGFFMSPQSSPPSSSDPPNKRHLLNIFQVDISTRLQRCLKQSIFRVPSDTLSQAFANGKPPTREQEEKVKAGSKDEGHDDISDTFVGVVGSYSQQSSPEQVRFRLFKWSHRHRQSKEGMEAHECLPTVVDVPYTHRKHMYYAATQVKLKAEKEEEKKREARKKRREEKKRNDKNVVTPTNHSSDTQSPDTQQSAQLSQASPPSKSQTIGIASHVDAAALVTHIDETTPRAGCWSCFRLFICTRV